MSSEKLKVKNGPLTFSCQLPASCFLTVNPQLIEWLLTSQINRGRRLNITPFGRIQPFVD
jgi:hypothetical protein